MREKKSKQYNVVIFRTLFSCATESISQINILFSIIQNSLLRSYPIFSTSHAVLVRLAMQDFALCYKLSDLEA